MVLSAAIMWILITAFDALRTSACTDKKQKMHVSISQTINITSTPVIRTGIYPHMWIAVTGLFVTPGPTKCTLPKLCIFWTCGLTPGPKFTKREMTCYPLRSIILPNFITLHQPMPETYVTKVFADKHTNGERYILSMPIGMWR